MDYRRYLKHYGVLGMRWGVRKKEDTTIIKRGQDIHRIVPRQWEERERTLQGHAYASFKKEDVEQYKKFARLFGGNEDNYVDMTFAAKTLLISPSEKTRVDTFIKLMDSRPDAKLAFIKATRHPLVFMPKNRLNHLDDPKEAEKAYRKFSYLLVSQRSLRDPYFSELEKQGYSMILDDADIKGKIATSPIIIFDRTKSLNFKTSTGI